ERGTTLIPTPRLEYGMQCRYPLSWNFTPWFAANFLTGAGLGAPLWTVFGFFWGSFHLVSKAANDWKR
ncbi:MAG: hypothetical protein AB7H97_21615, partial [Pseudobdellovibrionaceae bacterium]